MSAGRAVWVKIRASEAEPAEWHAKARSAGLTLSDLVLRIQPFDTVQIGHGNNAIMLLTRRFQRAQDFR